MTYEGSDQDPVLYHSSDITQFAPSIVFNVKIFGSPVNFIEGCGSLSKDM